jgi:hypothetical protein
MESSAVKVSGAAAVPAVPKETFLGSTVGQKMVMAVTGSFLVIFVIGHMIGNLQVYLGPESLNHYGELLRELLHGSFIWIFRAAIITAVVLHVWAATATTLGSWKARPIGYRKQAYVESTYASRTMRWGGPILFLFIVYHILHQRLVGLGLLYLLHDRAGPSPLAWRLEHAADAGAEPPELQRTSQGDRLDHHPGGRPR